jgi:D-xylose transport system permease protein
MTDAALTPTTVATPKRSIAERLGNELRFVPVALGLVALILFFATQSDVFLTSRNLNNLLIQSTVTGIIALGLVFVLLTGEIDLSVAATSGIAAVFMAKMVVDFGMPIPLAIAAGVLLGAIVGAASGRWVTLIGVPSFVVTLGVGLILNGIQLLLLPRTGSVQPAQYRGRGSGRDTRHRRHGVGAGAVAIAVFALVMASTWRSRQRAGLSASFNTACPASGCHRGVFLIGVSCSREPPGFADARDPLSRSSGRRCPTSPQTRFGVYLYAIGNNAEAARRAGIKVTASRSPHSPLPEHLQPSVESFLRHVFWASPCRRAAVSEAAVLSEELGLWRGRVLASVFP